jgi:Family of unknown function (DUF5681)
MSEKTKRSVPKLRVDKQRGNNAKKPRGKPFEKGNQVGFKPGVSGNPGGRPKSRALSEELRARLQQQYPGRGETTYGRLVAEKLVDLAIDGEIAAIREIFDRIEGKPRQAIDLTADEQRRKLVENAIAALMAETNVSREQAIDELVALIPEAAKWIHL